MPDINLELGDAVELAELLAFLADWLSGSQRQTLADYLTAFRRPSRRPRQPTRRRPPLFRVPATPINASENPHHD
jgi:hypothetical protein